MLKLSIIVIVFRMQKQAMNTLYSLSADYQKNVEASDYEVIVVENASDGTLDDRSIKNLASNFKYFLRNETGVSPAPAINFALTKCRGEMIGLMIDGARMLTPGVVSHVLSLRKIFSNPFVAVPGYHLGNQLQEFATGDQFVQEQTWLESIDWRSNGYRLFENACFSPGNNRGYFHPLMECTALFTRSQCFADIDGAEEMFSLKGGGSLNLHLYRKLGLLPNQKLVILPGEGNFHQYHDGVTTSAYKNRQNLIDAFNSQLNSFWAGQYAALRKEPMVFGQVGAAAQRFLESSCMSGMKRFSRFAGVGAAPWPDDGQNYCE